MSIITNPRNVIYALHLGDYNYRYVGLTTQKLRTRMMGHKYESTHNKTNMAVHAWIRKYGFESICVDVIVQEDNHDLLGLWEDVTIKSLREMGFHLLNLSEGGLSGSAGYKWTSDQLLARNLRKGELHPHSKVSDLEAIGIFEMKGRATAISAAKLFGVSEAVVRGIWSGVTRSHLTGQKWQRVAPKARPSKSESVFMSRAGLTSSDAERIVEMRATGMKLREIADEFGVHLSTIGKITTGAHWGGRVSMPVSSPKRRRYLHELSQDEEQYLIAQISMGESYTSVGSRLGVHRSTVREWYKILVEIPCA